MTFPSFLIPFICGLLATAALASPANTERILKSYEVVMAKWNTDMRISTSPEERQAALKARPDPATYATKIWQEISQSLAEEWSLDAAAWFIRISNGLATTLPNGASAPAFAQEIDAIRKAVETHHMSSKKLIPMCIALVSSQDPRSLKLLEKIQAEHPDPSTQGVAALGAAMLLKGLGEDPELLRKRLGYIRKSIIQSSEITLEGTSVAKLAEDELYIIRYLSKGRTAPDLVGIDTSSRALNLSSFAGKVIILLFWNSSIQDVERTLTITSDLEKKFRDRPLVIIGVNSDPSEKLRAMQADETLTWPNFTDPENKLAAEYRVGSWPLVYVLDGERKIHYVGPPGSFVELTAEALLSDSKSPAKE